MNHDFPFDLEKNWQEVETILKMFFQFKMARGFESDARALEAYRKEFDQIAKFINRKGR